MAHARGLCVRTQTPLKEEQFDVIAIVSLSYLLGARAKVVLVGSREVKVFAEAKLLNSYAIFFSAPSCQAKQY